MSSAADPSLVVLGAAGGVGHHVVTEALRAGLTVTATARDPEKFRALDVTAGLPAGHADRLAVAAADVRDEKSVTLAVEGHDVVVCAVGPPGRRSGGLYADAARTSVAAMRRCGVERFVGVTSAGVRYDDPELAPWYRWLVRPLLGEVYADMIAMERLVTEAEGVDWTFVRPVLLLDREPTGTYRVQDAATPRRGRSITRADVGAFVVSEIRWPEWSRRAPTLAR